jgi:N-acyl-D-aspartate/D-glutamate deacylase
MSLEALRAGIRWDFETVPQYLDMLERQGAALNIAAFVGHSSVRTYVMGEAATERAASAAEIREMQAIVLAALRAGAIGFASSTSPAHNGAAGRPMPSRLAEQAEFAALVGALREHGRGLFMLTKGGQTTIEFLEELAADCGRPVVIAALLHNSTQPDGVFSDLRAIARANQRGHRLAGAVSCCPLAMDFTLHSPYTFESLESWRPALALQGKDYERRLAEPAFRAAVRAEIARPGHFRLFNGEWDKVLVVESRQRQLEGRTIAQLAAEARSDPLDAMLDLALAEDLDTVFSALLLNSDEKAVARLLADPHALVSLSDAGAHLTFFNDAGYGLHLLGYWTRERGALTLEQAAWRLTGQPAALYGIKDRGALREGHHADLLLFDPRTVARTANRRVFDLPAGASRLTCDAVGVHGVWVNGERIADRHGARATSRLPGRLLRDFAA